jgi:hypothetical protein
MRTTGGNAAHAHVRGLWFVYYDYTIAAHRLLIPTGIDKRQRHAEGEHS